MTEQPTTPQADLSAERHLLAAFEHCLEAIGAYLHAVRQRCLPRDSAAELVSISFSSGVNPQDIIDIERGEMNISGEEMSRLPERYQCFSKLTMTMLLGVFTFVSILRCQLRRIIANEGLTGLSCEAEFRAEPSEDPNELN